MNRCDCGEYFAGGGYFCPACRRNQDLMDRYSQNAIADQNDREILLEQSHIKEVLRKLLDLAVESVDDSKLAEKKVKVIMKSAVFVNNEREFFSEIKANSFLADCYFKLHLGAKPTIEKLKSLSDNGIGYVDTWASTYQNKTFSSKVKKLYAEYLSQKTKKEKHDEEERKKQELILAEESAKIESERKINEGAKKVKHNLIAIPVSVICTIISFLGFITIGYYKFSSLALSGARWINGKNRTEIMPSEWLTYGLAVIFGILIIIYTYMAYTVAYSYMLGRIKGNEKPQWFWPSILLLFSATCYYWSVSTGNIRILLILSTIGMPFIPYIRGGIASFAIGIIAGFFSIYLSFIICCLIAIVYYIIMKS